MNENFVNDICVRTLSGDARRFSQGLFKDRGRVKNVLEFDSKKLIIGEGRTRTDIPGGIGGYCACLSTSILALDHFPDSLKPTGES